MNKFEKACWIIGPGGLSCSCCGPAPGKDRKVARRAAKRRMKRIAFKFEEDANGE